MEFWTLFLRIVVFIPSLSKIETKIYSNKKKSLSNFPIVGSVSFGMSIEVKNLLHYLELEMSDRCIEEESISSEIHVEYVN